MSWSRYQFQVMRLEVHEIEASSLDSARAYAKEWCDSQRLPFGILMFDHCVAAPVILRALTPIPDAMPREAA